MRHTTTGPKSTRLRLFIIEAPSPVDLLRQRAEAPALEKASILIGHEATSLVVKSKRELKAACQFIASIEHDQNCTNPRHAPLAIHLAAHGNANGLVVGNDLVSWKDLCDTLRPVCSMREYKGDVIVVISACGAAQQKLTPYFTKLAKRNSAFRPPIYLFVTGDDTPTFPGALVSWIVFYHLLPDWTLSDKKQAQDMLNSVKAAGASTLNYFRWDEDKKRYLHFAPKTAQ